MGNVWEGVGDVWVRSGLSSILTTFRQSEKSPCSTLENWEPKGANNRAKFNQGVKNNDVFNSKKPNRDNV